MLTEGSLDYIAITDHNSIDFAVQLKAELTVSDRKSGTHLADRIIIGEEIRTTRGEIIGLYLERTVPKMLSPEETVAAIREQGGLVCIPHPFENVRSGMSAKALELIADDVDMMEVHNGRAVFQNKTKQAHEWVNARGCAGVASSDCHTWSGWGRTYTVLTSAPSRETLVELLHEATYKVGFPGLVAVFAPKSNRLKKRLHRRKDQVQDQHGDKGYTS